jgi:hypothetical protein
MPRLFLEKPDRRLLRTLAVIHGILYIALVASLVTLRLTLELFSRAPFGELIYGPAITAVSTFCLYWLAISVRIERRRG